MGMNASTIINDEMTISGWSNWCTNTRYILKPKASWITINIINTARSPHHLTQPTSPCAKAASRKLL